MDRSGGCPEATAHVAWAGDLVSLQPSTERSWVGTVLSHCNQCVLQEEVFGICWHDGNQVPRARMELAMLTMIIVARGQTILISQILVSRQAVEKGEAISEVDVDVVVAEAPEVVVDRLVHALLHIALDLAALRIWNLLLLLQSGRILWERPLDDGRLQLYRLATRLGLRLGRRGSTQGKHSAQSECCDRSLMKNISTNHADWKIANKHTKTRTASPTSSGTRRGKFVTTCRLAHRKCCDWPARRDGNDNTATCVRGAPQSIGKQCFTNIKIHNRQRVPDHVLAAKKKTRL